MKISVTPIFEDQKKNGVFGIINEGRCLDPKSRRVTFDFVVTQMYEVNNVEVVSKK